MVSLCVLGIHWTKDNAQQNLGIITETLVDCDRFTSFHPFYDLYESHTLAFAPHDFAGYPLLCYLKAISVSERLSCVIKRFHPTTEFT